MKIIRFIGFNLVMMLALISFSQQLWAKDVTITPAISLKTLYDDNLDFSNKDEKDSFGANAVPSLTLSYASELLEFLLIGEVDVIILRLESPTANIDNIPKRLINRRKLLFYTLDGNLQMDRKEYIVSIENLLSGKEYGISLWNDPWLVLKRGEVNPKLQQAQKVGHKLKQLRKNWKIKIE